MSEIKVPENVFKHIYIYIYILGEHIAITKNEYERLL